MDDLPPENLIALAAALLALDLPGACVAGVAENLRALAAHARALEDGA